MTSDVGTLVGAPPVKNVKLFVRLMTRFEPVGTVMITGDQWPAATATGFSAVQVAGATTAPQV